MTNKAEEPTKPETTVADKPKPQAQPIPDEADLPKGELTVRPKAQPQTQPKADNPSSPLENVPSPYKPNQPNSPQFDPTKVIPPIIGASTATVGKIVADKINETDIAPNGVKNIHKREWSNEEYQKWFNNLPKKYTPANSEADIYEIIQTGDTNYQISGSGEKYWADGIQNKRALDAKFIIDPERSPAIPGSKFPEFLRSKIEAKSIRSELLRASKILQDKNNPLTSLRIITNDSRAVPYFEKLMREYKVPGEVIVEEMPKLEETK